MMALGEKPITKEDVDRQIAIIDEGQKELNRIGQACRGYQKDILEMEAVLNASRELDTEIVKHMKMQIQIRKQQKPLA